VDSGCSGGQKRCPEGRARAGDYRWYDIRRRWSKERRTVGCGEGLLGGRWGHRRQALGITAVGGQAIKKIRGTAGDRRAWQMTASDHI